MLQFSTIYEFLHAYIYKFRKFNIIFHMLKIIRICYIYDKINIIFLFREMWKNKEHLKQQIVNQKYFTENEPRFLTFAEKQLICKLFKFNPEEWTVEKLSESFPALPETIQKIVHSNWMPESVERIMQYDNVAIENWKKFHIGKLPVSPRFNEHLKKFKNRKIILADRESLAIRFVSPKPKFKEPKSQLFSNIIQSYVNEKKDKKLLLQANNSHNMEDIFAHSNKNQTLLITNNKTENNSIDKNSKKFILKEEQYLTSNLHIDSEKHNIFNKKNNSKKLFTFDEFVKAKMKNIQKKCPKEGIVLLNLYRKQIDATQEIKTASDNAIIHMEKDTLEIVQKSNKSISEISKNKDDNIVIADDNLIDTSIKIWNKKIDAECDYAKSLKISKNLYKPGMTYRINDCYYDDDGEFLYRIPGIQT